MAKPAHALAISLILKHVDANPGTITDKRQQLAFLRHLTSRRRLPYHSSIYGNTRHDEKSLRSVAITIMRKHAVPGLLFRDAQTPVDVLFERGSQVLDDKFVQAVNHAAGMARQDSSTHSSCSSEGDNSDEEISVEPIDVDDSGDDDYAPPHPRRTRSNAGKMRAQSASTSMTAAPGPRDSLPFRAGAVSSANKTADVEAIVTIVKDEGAASQKRKASSLGEEIAVPFRHLPVKRTIPQKPKGRLPPPRSGVSRPAPGSTAVRGEVTPGDERHEVLLLTKALNYSVRSLVSTLFQSLAANGREQAELVLHPAPHLALLYGRVFGGSDWKAGAIELLVREALPASDFMRSLIAAFLHERVFCLSDGAPDLAADPPWTSPLSLKASTSCFQQYVAPLMSARHGADVSTTLAQAALAQLQDSQFVTTTLQPMARHLANDLRLSLNAQLQILLGSCPGPNNLDWHETLLKGLEETMTDALVLCGRLAAADQQYRWVWIARGKEYDGRGMDRCGERKGSKVGLTVFPGLAMHAAEEAAVENDVCCRASVGLL